MKNKNNLIAYLAVFILLPVMSFFITKNPNLVFLLLFFSLLIFFVFVYIFKNPIAGLVLLIYTLPFERFPVYDLGFVNLKINQLIAGLIIVSYMLRPLFNKNIKINNNNFIIGWFLSLLILVGFMSAITSYDLKRSLTVLVFTIFVSAASYVFVKSIGDKDQIKKIINALFQITIFICLFALYQFLADIVGISSQFTILKDIYTKEIMGFPRIHAFSMEPLYFANFIFMPLGLALSYYFFHDESIISNKKSILLIFLIILCIILGISRGAYVALGCMILFFILVAFRKVLTFKNIFYTLFTSIFLISSVIIFLNFSNPEALQNFINHAQIQDFETGESVQKRLFDYQKAIDYWQEKPIIGIGPGNYGPRYLDYPNHEDVTDWEIVNNQYIEVLTEWGIIGLILYILIILTIFIRSFFAYKITKDKFLKASLIGSSGAMLAIFVQYNFFSTIYIMHIWVFIGLIIAIQNLAFNYDKKD